MAEPNLGPRNGRFPVSILVTDEWRDEIIGRILVALTYTNFDKVVKGKISDVALDPTNPNNVIVTIAWSRKQEHNRQGDLVIGDDRWGKKEHEPRDFSIPGSADTSVAGLVADFHQANGRILIRGADGSLFRIPRRRSTKK